MCKKSFPRETLGFDSFVNDYSIHVSFHIFGRIQHQSLSKNKITDLPSKTISPSSFSIQFFNVITGLSSLIATISTQAVTVSSINNGFNKFSFLIYINCSRTGKLWSLKCLQLRETTIGPCTMIFLNLVPDA